MVRWSEAAIRATLLAVGVCAISGLRGVAQQPQDKDQPVHVTLAEAIKRAQANEPAFAAAMAAQQTASIDGYLAKAALLPTAVYHNQVLYTQSNGEKNQGGQIGSQAAPIFIANNAVHEYASQATINETIGLKQIANAQIASANAARAAAEMEIARRGLVTTVVGLYYGVASAQEKASIQEEALGEARAFAELTQKRETAREAAHADVVKAELQTQQKQRDFEDARIAADKARLELGVLLFADPRAAYSTDAPSVPPQLPAREEIDAMASKNNPEMRSALAEVSAANAGVKSARAAYLPDLGLNFTYGIDAPQFAKRGPDAVNNLGYSMSATVDLPVWDWFSTQKKIKQSEIQRNVAKVNLTAAQRRLIASLEESYMEARVARDQLALLDASVTTAQENLRLTKLRYAAGESTALEMVDAQNYFLAARTAKTDGLVRFENAMAALRALTGSF
ncbi:MAG TPA: TolC family protein [Acidobacteriaceae bacterium]|nr:TolC family protein [Acidobacteriaceae bacterium]